MNHPKLTLVRILSRKLAVILLLVVSAAGAYATLGDGKSKSTAHKSPLLSNRTSLKPGLFSLKSGYSYRGNNVITNNSEKRYIRLNTVVTVQKGNISYIVPLKKKAILQNVKIDLSNRQLRRN
ncbi:MAG TPA: hypothetical protein VK483_08965 [Chitinophagaceae bacterium]|nr:hypothetical protein [Chitinophagaceae bacterium]